MIKPTTVLPSLLIATILSILLSLGFWQLERADEKRGIENAIILAQKHPAELVETIQDLHNKEYYQVLLKGHYDVDKQFIYDNQIVKNNAGYYVLTPFVINKNNAILINRGFVPWHGRRDKLADIRLNTNETTIKVRLIKPKQRIKLRQQNVEKHFPILIQSLDMTQLSKLSGYDLVPMLAQLDIDAQQGFYRKWKPFYGSVDKHLGYALQWFLMALTLFIIAIYLFVKNKHANT